MVISNDNGKYQYYSRKEIQKLYRFYIYLFYPTTWNIYKFFHRTKNKTYHFILSLFKK